jgi:hypothetical protein
VIRERIESALVDFGSKSTKTRKKAVELCVDFPNKRACTAHDCAHSREATPMIPLLAYGTTLVAQPPADEFV